MSKQFIAVWHVDDEDGRWSVVEGDNAEDAAKSFMEQIKEAYPNAYYINVHIGDVVVEYGDYYYDDSPEYTESFSEKEDDFDRRWKEKFGEPRSHLMTVEDFNEMLKEMIDFE